MRIGKRNPGTLRLQVLRGENMSGVIGNMKNTLIESAVARFLTGDTQKEWDLDGLKEYLERMCVPFGTVDANRENLLSGSKEEAMELFKKAAQRFYEEREAHFKELGIDMRELERAILLRAVDLRWMDHIDAMDQLRDGIGLRAYAQRDPVNEYKLESYDMFEEMVHLIQEDTVRRLYQLKLERAPERQAAARPTAASHSSPAANQSAPRNPVKAGEKIGRNSPCPCGSGKKYKNCCGRNAGGND